tara:strand:+ start:498 stop:692 length:195 start_codon:yes stop_codon:yes gene_type:complete
MKIKKIESVNLPNAWKQCGVSLDDWQKLKNGEVIEVNNIVDEMNHLVVEVDSSPKPKKEVKGGK